MSIKLGNIKHRPTRIEYDVVITFPSKYRFHYNNLSPHTFLTFKTKKQAYHVAALARKLYKGTKADVSKYTY